MPLRGLYILGLLGSIIIFFFLRDAVEAVDYRAGLRAGKVTPSVAEQQKICMAHLSSQSKNSVVHMNYQLARAP